MTWPFLSFFLARCMIHAPDRLLCLLWNIICVARRLERRCYPHGGNVSISYYIYPSLSENAKMVSIASREGCMLFFSSIYSKWAIFMMLFLSQTDLSTAQYRGSISIPTWSVTTLSNEARERPIVQNRGIQTEWKLTLETTPGHRKGVPLIKIS